MTALWTKRDRGPGTELVAAVVVLLVVLIASVAWSAPAWFQRTAIVGSAAADIGTGSTSGLTLVSPGIGADFLVAPTLRIRASGRALAPIGRTDDGRQAGGGGGGDLALDLVPFTAWPVRPYVRWSAGILLFLDEPFLPGGDIYDFMLAMGGGIEADVAERLSLQLGVQASHISNGQGLGPFNPAFDGVAVTGALRYALAVPASVTNPWDGYPATGLARPSWRPGAIVEGDAGKVAGASLLSSRVSIAERVADHMLAQFEAELGTLAGEPVGEVGVEGAGHARVGSAGVYAGYRQYVGIDTLVLQGQIEAHATDELSAVAMGNWERHSLFDDTVRAALGLRAWPSPSLRIELGVGGDPRGKFHSSSLSDAYWGMEWRLPLGLQGLGASVALERRVSDAMIVGVRIAWDMGSTLREAARSSGWRRLR